MALRKYQEYYVRANFLNNEIKHNIKFIEKSKIDVNSNGNCKIRIF